MAFWHDPGSGPCWSGRSAGRAKRSGLSGDPGRFGRGRQVLLGSAAGRSSGIGHPDQNCFPVCVQPVIRRPPRRSPASLLVVATTHQLLRFTSYFDLVIVDEADAFPLYNNPMLEAALDRVVRPAGKQIYLTATPDRSWRRQAEQGTIAVPVPSATTAGPFPSPSGSCCFAGEGRPAHSGGGHDFILTRKPKGGRG